ncbi:WXG100-like domain-containing protein [Sphaerisporangium corydalis]|uniref:Outer membrane channel protein CpnT-like N-terminal domain-containing protein n=1 Tax=Sphaerisporangium corydalis TaxID=1441875 RepID=A0ABV9EAH9_9ACTN|nr:hypothetical protein [Sphaerisporangium corydalis]
MALRLPGELAGLLHALGFAWPESDEDRLLDMGRAWIAFSGRIGQPVGEAARHALGVLDGNSGEAFDAFGRTWAGGEGPAPALRDGATAATVIGTGLIVCAGIVLALKLNIIVQLSQLAVQIFQAVTAAPGTAGASLALIALYKKRTGVLIGMLTTLATQAISNP